jgi:hypothetical protein
VNFSFHYQNANPFDHNPIDLFFALSDDDFECYRQAVADRAFLTPCDFLYDELKTRIDNQSISTDFSLAEFQQLTSRDTAAIVVDNSLFPGYPRPGAFQNYPIEVEATSAIHIHDDSFYRSVCLVLASVLGTATLIMLVVNLVLFGKLYRITSTIRHHQIDEISPFRYSSSS